MVRVAVIDVDFCKPGKCNRECIRFCPIVRSGAEAIKFNEELSRPIISEQLCTGCGICIKKCPFNAIRIVNLPDELEELCVHRYGPNSFKLYRLPVPREGMVLGLLGPNGAGKTTSLKILGGIIKPNLGLYDCPPDWGEILKYFRGSELYNYFKKLSEGKLRIITKPQYIDEAPKNIVGTVGEILRRIDERGALNEICEKLSLSSVMDKDIHVLSGGELQRVAIAAAALRDADVYIFDEPSSYLDIYQRLKMASLLRDLAKESKYVLVAEHDLAVLDYLSDYVCIYYGKPGVYGIVSKPHGVRVGINLYINGYIPDENIRFRSYEIKFNLSPIPYEWKPEDLLIRWPNFKIKLGNFELISMSGSIHKGEIIGVVGPNGIGKTTFVKAIAGLIEPKEGYIEKFDIKVSYKPQYVVPNTDKTIKELIESINPSLLGDPWFKEEILLPLEIEPLLDRRANTLSGGELQRASVALCLSREAKLFLLDEPTAHLDVEHRLAVARCIKRIVEKKKAAALVVEHDVVAIDLMADSIMVFTGNPGRFGYANSPTTLRKGMNQFLKEVDITFRRDPDTGRPRVNKKDSWLDRYQKEINEYYYTQEV
ncbi:MAG: ribosome biogenesis/translation initiation ATPase RLI [Candidatus Methanomethyliaceae archaeon]|nr:ribosome biogenesis/translation initiation ATPase RLI [Candidatus Methanomethyliaceae archaeon]MDW7971517.1 ribosome biogenesis/translation initiation ATPase RLI [Nitrososphaerota archaeon]